MDYFDRRCRESGFDGIYTIETYSLTYHEKDYQAFHDNLCTQTKKAYLREPSIAVNHRRLAPWKKWLLLPVRAVRKVIRILFFKGRPFWLEKYDADKLYERMLKERFDREDVCHGVFFSWDNTPRHQMRGFVIDPPSKEMFMRYADRVKDDEYVFINAWNEWAEGMVLEPTTKDGYKYLEWIREWNEKNRKNEG